MRTFVAEGGEPREAEEEWRRTPPAASTPPRARGRRRKRGAPLDVPEQDEGSLARAASDLGCLLSILLAFKHLLYL